MTENLEIASDILQERPEIPKILGHQVPRNSSEIDGTMTANPGMPRN